MAKKKAKNKKRTGGRRRSRGRGRVGAISQGLGMETLAGIVVGGFGAMALNGIAKNVAFLQKSKWLLPATKVVGGFLLANNTSSAFAQGAGGGMVLQGVFDGGQTLAPNVFNKLTGGGSAQINPSVGATLIDLDDVRGIGSGMSMEDEQAVAGLYDVDSGVAGIV